MKKRTIKIPKSRRIYIRREKARIRREVSVAEDQKQQIAKLYPSESNER